MAVGSLVEKIEKAPIHPECKYYSETSRQWRRVKECIWAFERKKEDGKWGQVGQISDKTLQTCGVAKDAVQAKNVGKKVLDVLCDHMEERPEAGKDVFMAFKRAILAKMPKLLG